MTAPTPGAIEAARLHGTTMKRTISIIALAVAALASHAADTPVPAALVMHLPDGTTLTPMLATAHMTKDYKGDTVAVMQWNGINKRAPSINHRIVVKPRRAGGDVRFPDDVDAWEEHRRRLPVPHVRLDVRRRHVVRQHGREHYVRSSDAGRQVTAPKPFIPTPDAIKAARLRANLYGT